MNSAAQSASRLADRLRAVRVSLRSDLETTRHVFRGQPAYVLRDPLTFQSHRFDRGDYEILCRLDASRSLGDIFEQIVAEGRSTRDNEETFYQFVFSLHRLGFLQLPFSDDKLLYKRFVARQKSQTKRRLMSILFLQVPLWNPDAFLSRTVDYVRPLFSRWCFALWLCLMAGAGAVLIANGRELWAPLNGVLAAQSLGLMWLTLIVLKTFHEFGHAYACKHFGAHVPDMGVYLILGTPCAYVDATASWGLTSKLQRIIICLAGMYFESIIAALAVFVWAATEPGLLNSIAYNVIFLASVVTVLFNINPLMRFDGYYVASDLLEVPNLRQRSTQHVVALLKRFALGVRVELPHNDRRLAVTLTGYGVAANGYRVMIMLWLAALISTKLYVVGLMLGAVYITSTLWSVGRKMIQYAWLAEEAAPVRGRAIAVTCCALIGVPAAALLVPIQSSITAAGVLGREVETVVRAQTVGFFHASRVSDGQAVTAAEPLADLSNDQLEETRLTAAARLAAAELRREAYLAKEPALARQEQAKADAAALELARREQQIESLHVRAPLAGEVVSALDGTKTGMFVQEGAELATLVSGAWEVRAVLAEEQVAAAATRVGDVVEFRPAGDPEQRLRGVVSRITPGGSRVVAHPSLTHLGGGDIPVSPDKLEASRPYFEITIRLDAGGSHMRYGMTGQARLAAPAEPIGRMLYRRVIRFVNKLSQS